MARLKLVRGLPGSGKSTYAKNLLAKGVCQVHYEADTFFMTNEGFYDFDATKLYQAHKWCYDKVKQSLSLGLDVVVSNTFTRKREVRPYQELCAELGCELEIVTLTHNYGSIHDVDEATMSKMKKRFISHGQLSGAATW